ncbi:MAG: CbtB domain-containing protein [Hyphomicrobiales bacterium]
MTALNLSTVSVSIEQRLIAGIVALVMGLGIVATVGFAGSAEIHNAAHDTRHSLGFPCH